jgi:hypothetical protein
MVYNGAQGRGWGWPPRRGPGTCACRAYGPWFDPVWTANALVPVTMVPTGNVNDHVIPALTTYTELNLDSHCVVGRQSGRRALAALYAQRGCTGQPPAADVLLGTGGAHRRTPDALS